MSIKKDLLTIVPLVTGLALLQLSMPSQSAPFKKLSSVKFVPSTHNVGGSDITSHSNDRKMQTTQLPISINQNLEVRFAINFSGSSGGPGIAYINPTSNQNMIQCYTHSTNNADAGKNKIGSCYAKADYLDDITEETTVKLRFNSPGGGGNKYLDWKFVPPATQNGVKSIVAPSAVYKGDALSTQVILDSPAADAQTLYIGYYPKSCFQWEGNQKTIADNSALIGFVSYAKNEVQQTVDVNTLTSCKSTSGFIKIWYADPGKRPNQNLTPDMQKSIQLRTRRR